MKGLLQRVSSAQVAVDGKVVSKISRGLLVLLGISGTDTEQDLEYICRKVLNIRLFDHNGKPWRLSVMDTKLEMLVVSQFTLYAKLKGNKPDFHSAMTGEYSQPMYNTFLDLARRTYDPSKIKGGVFGANMTVSLDNDGPVTIEISSDGIQHRPKKKPRILPSKAEKESRENKESGDSETRTGTANSKLIRNSLSAALLWEVIKLSDSK